MMNNERGAVLAIVLATSVIFGIAAFGLLSLTVNKTRQTAYLGEGRLRARYAAEGGVVMAMQELWEDPTDCTFGPYDVGGTAVTVTRTGCPAPGPSSQLRATVTWTP